MFVEFTTTQNDRSAYDKVLHFLFAQPSRKFTLTQIVDRLHIHRNTANKIIKELEKENLIQKEVIGKAWQVQIVKAFERKTPYNLEMFAQSNLVEEIKKKYPQAKSIILFGSYRKGDDNEDSDVDIAVELTETELKVTSAGIFKKLGYRTDVPVNLHVFCRKGINNNLFANIANGIVLDGFLEV